MAPYPIGRDRLILPIYDAAHIDAIKRVVQEHVGPQEEIFMGPAFTTFYCLLDRKSPTREIYFVLPASAKTEEDDIRRLDDKKVRWVLVSDYGIFRNSLYTLPDSRPRLWAYLKAHYKEAVAPGIPTGIHLLQRV
jgi:hypothetical protein